MKSSFSTRISVFSMLSAVLLGGCANVEYRCPLDGSKPASPTACAGMKDALYAAKRGTGGKTSVLMDDKGRIVPNEVASNRSVAVLASPEPYAQSGGNPVYEQGSLFKAYTPGYQDGNGMLHEGRHSWFATPGHFKYGSVSVVGDGGTVAGNALLQPSNPNELPSGRIVVQDPKAVQGQKVLTAPESKPAPSDKEALQSLSSATSKAATKAAAGKARPVSPGQNQAAPGVTAPGLGLAD